MAGFSLDVIKRILRDYEKSDAGQKVMKNIIADYRRRGISKTMAGSEVPDVKRMKELAEEFISLLSMKAQSYRGQGDGAMPVSVVNHFSSLYCDEPIEEKDGSFTIRVRFADDLSRKSLDRGPDTSGGISNIVALFNNGVAYDHYVFGWWDGHAPIGESVYRSGVGANSAYVRSKKDRPGLHFMQEAIEEFEAKYGEKYAMSITPNEIYTRTPGAGSSGDE